MQALNAAGAPLPLEMGIGKQKSQLEGRDYAEAPTLSIKKISAGEFQDTSERFLADAVPCRDSVVLANAGAQRACIQIANMVMRFEAYPAFFGSDTSVVPDDRLIIPTAMAQSPENQQAAEEFIRQINELAAEYEEIRFVYDALVAVYESPYNPTYGLCSNAFSEDWTEQNILSKLDPNRFDAIYEPMTSYDEFKSSWLTTEHHWTFQRALSSYNLIADKLGLKPATYENPILVNGSWHGARCRLGLDLDYTSELYDVPDDFSYLEWKTLEGKHATYGKRDAFLAGEYSFGEDPVYNVFDTYFGSATVQANNKGPNNGKRCLVICVSFARPLKGYIAQNYAQTVFVAPSINPVDISLKDLIDQGNFDDVIIQLAEYSYAGMNKVSPNFLAHH